MGYDNIQHILSRLFTAAVLLCAAVLGVGLLLFVLNPSAQVPANAIDSLRAILQLNPHGVVFLGIAILVATPVIRVIISLVYFARIRDTTYVRISVYVLFIILLGILAGLV